MGKSIWVPIVTVAVIVLMVSAGVAAWMDSGTETVTAEVPGGVEPQELDALADQMDALSDDVETSLEEMLPKQGGEAIESLSVAGDFKVSPTELQGDFFTVDPDMGVATVDGKLQVNWLSAADAISGGSVTGDEFSLNSGAWAVRSNGNVTSSGSASFGGDLAVAGDGSFDSVTVNSGLTVEDLTVNGDSLQSGDALLGGSVGAVSGDWDIAQDGKANFAKLTVAEDGAIGGKLVVAGSAAIGGDLAVAGSASVDETITGSSALVIGGAGDFGGNITGAADIDVEGDLYAHRGFFDTRVWANSLFNNNGNWKIYNDGTAWFADDVSTDGDLHAQRGYFNTRVWANSLFNNNGNWSILNDGDAAFNGTLDVGGDAYLRGTLDVAGDADFSSRIRVADDAVFGADLRNAGGSWWINSPTGNADFNNTRVNQIRQDNWNWWITDDGYAHFDDDIHTFRDVYARRGYFETRVWANALYSNAGSWEIDRDGNAEFNGTLDVAGNSYLDGTLALIGDADLNSRLRVAGNAQFQANTMFGGSLSSGPGSAWWIDSPSGRAMFSNVNITSRIGNPGVWFIDSSGDIVAWNGAFRLDVSSETLTSRLSAWSVDRNGNAQFDRTVSADVLSSNLAVWNVDRDGNAYFGRTVSADVLSSNLGVWDVDRNGNASFARTLTVGGAASVGTTITAADGWFSGDAIAGGDVRAARGFFNSLVRANRISSNWGNWEIDLGGNADFSGSLAVSGAASVDETITAGSDVNVAGMLDAASLNVGSGWFTGDVFATNGWFSGDINATGDMVAAALSAGTGTFTTSVLTPAINTNANAWNITDAGVATFGDNLNVAGTTRLAGILNVGAGEFKVDPTTGVTQVGGILNVAGTTRLAGILNVGAGKFRVDPLTGVTHVGGTLNVVDATTLGGTLGVTGDADFDANVNVDGNLNVAGTITSASIPNVVGIQYVSDGSGRQLVSGYGPYPSDSVAVISWAQPAVSIAPPALPAANVNGAGELYVDDAGVAGQWHIIITW